MSEILLVASCLVAAALLALAARILFWRINAPSLPLPLASAPPTAALLPVRDEEDNVLQCLDTLLAQTAALEILVIDDGSTDATAQLVAERAAREPRLRLVSAGTLPNGWGGKVHALYQGARKLTTPWLLLTDADTRHEPELLARAHAAVRDKGLDAVSLAGTQDTVGIGESLLTPVVMALLDALLGDWRVPGRGEGPPVANGQFILVRSDALHRSGGFAELRSVIIDDVALFDLLASKGFRWAFLRAPGQLRTRMYRGFRASLQGWRRNLRGLLGRRLGLVAAALGVLLTPPLLLAANLVTQSWWIAAALWLAGSVSSASIRWEVRPSAWPALLYPADAVLTALLLVLAAVDYRRGRLAPWKGRQMGGQLGAS